MSTNTKFAILTNSIASILTITATPILPAWPIRLARQLSAEPDKYAAPGDVLDTPSIR